MIVEAIVSIFVGLFSLVGSLFPDMDTPSFLTALAGHVSTVTGQMAPLGVWIPFGPAGTALGVVVGAYVAALLIRLIRIVLSFLTAGGGSAA